MNHEPGLPFLIVQLAIIAAGLAYVLQARRAARALLLIAGATMVTQSVLARLDPATRPVVVAVGVPLMPLAYGRRILELLLGVQGAGMVIGTWAVRFFDLIFRLPGAILRRLLR